MPARRVNPNLVKLHRSYSVDELARCCDVHKNTVRHWQAKGLEPIDKARPILFQGRAVRAFLSERNARRKRPCPAGTFYCFRCRTPRPPALGMVDFVPIRPGSGNLRALRVLRDDHAPAGAGSGNRQHHARLHRPIRARPAKPKWAVRPFPEL